MDEVEEEKEIQQTHENGRSVLTLQPVTVASIPSPQNTLTLALPIQHPRATAVAGGGGGREDCWSEGATSILIDAWGKDVQCKNRIDTCKKKYKIEKAKIASGQGTSKWIFFHRLDRLIGPNAKINAGLPTTLITDGSKFPVAIPVGVRTFHNKYQQQEKQPWLRQHQQKQQFQISGSLDSSSSSEAPPSPDSTDSLPPETVSNKRLRFEENVNSELPKTDSGTSKRNAGKGNSWANSLRELSQAISEFGEAYERAETTKLQQVVEMEKQRMGFANNLELQRMQFFTKTQLEITQLKQEKRVGSSHNHHHSNNNRNKSD
ncbi:hypothetical protein IFM89_021584 [Coptis chinensis]|uniref:Uncharacterized protein n=1 Tax=Coptis chinensis TaxID=261450 RepID=A0A835IFX3_9MAGN|nr:hypothetical protein IFM89_021584 [Coptis chinensis]